MVQTPTSGYGAYVNYGYESTYGSVASGTRTFGHGVKITISRKNTMERIHALGARNAQASVAKQYEGSASVEFVLSNGSFLRGVLGEVADGGSGPSSYTHTYTETNAIQSFSILTGTELGTNDEVTALIGAKMNTATITTSVNEVAKVRLECPYKTETLATSGIGSQVLETETPYVFSDGTLSVGGSPVGNVQSFELTINNNIEGVFGLGSRFKTAEIPKIRQYNIKMNVVFSDVATLLQRFYGNTTGPKTSTPASASLVLTLDNGNGQLVMTFADLYLDNETLPKDVNEIIKEDVDGWAQGCTSMVLTDSNAIDEGDP